MDISNDETNESMPNILNEPKGFERGKEPNIINELGKDCLLLEIIIGCQLFSKK